MNLHFGILIGIAVMGGGMFFLYRELDRIFEDERRASRSPFKEKLLRPPGEGLRLKIEKLRDELMEQALMLGGTLASTSILIIVFHSRSWLLNGIVWGGIAAVGLTLAWRFWNKLGKLRKNVRNCRLGFDGERYVAEKLSELTGQGYRVFHDFLFDMKPGGDATNFNIDHIVVGPAGVFVVETKTYRQPNGELEGGEESHRVKADGDAMLFPRGYRSRRPLDQARRNAEDLSTLLTGTSPRRVAVYPIVAMPGWYTDEDAFPDVLVLNPKRIPRRIALRKNDVLSPDEVRAIADRIEVHCRNVEGA